MQISVVQRLAASRSRKSAVAAGDYAPSTAGYARSQYIKITPCFTKWFKKLMVKIGSRIYMLMVAKEEPRSEHANSELVSTNEQQDERTHT